MLISIQVSTEVHSFFAILNFVACAVLIIVRVYHWKKQNTQILKLTVTGFLCMAVALLYCSALVNTQIEWYFGDDRWCELSMKLNTAAYSLHRVLLYIFIILRLEVINQSNLIRSWIIDVGKAVIGVTGTLMVVISTIFTSGVADQYFSCNFQMSNVVLAPMFVIDMTICVGGTWMFIRPLRLTLRNIESESLRDILRTTMIWSIVSLISTVITMLTLACIDGGAGVVGFDCTITSFCLVMMMSPAVRRRLSRRNSDSRQKASLEVKEIKCAVQKTPSSEHTPSNEILDKYFQEVLNERALLQV